MFEREYKLRHCLRISPNREVTRRKHNLMAVVLFPYINAIIN